MNIEVTEAGGAMVLRPEDELDLLGYQALAQRIDELLTSGAWREGSRKIVLDLGAVTYVSSPAVNVLLGAAAKAAKAGGRFSLVNVDGGARTCLEVTGALRSIPVYATVADAASA